MFGKIIGTGSYVPENVLENDDLKEFFETDDQWIRERTGIKRRHVMSNEDTSHMAYKAAERAIEMAGVSRESIDLIIVSTVSSNTILPNTACVVQNLLNAKNAMCFDINVACTGFITAYNIAQSYINSGLIETALIIGAEGLSKIIDWTDRTTAILFGDGAGAVIIKKDSGAKFETVMHADGSKGDALTCVNPIDLRKMNYSDIEHTELKKSHDNNLNESINNGNKIVKGKTFVEMNGQEVFRFAVRKVPECIEELIEKMQIEKSEIDLFLLHQANKRILESIGKRLKISMDLIPENVGEYGNTSSASIPILLDEMVRAGRIKKDSKVIMAGFGAGLTWSAVYVEF